MWVIKYDNGSYNLERGHEATLKECTKYNSWAEAKAITSELYGVVSVDPFEHEVSTMNNEELIKQMNAFIATQSLLEDEWYAPVRTMVGSTLEDFLHYLNENGHKIEIGGLDFYNE